MFVDPTLYFVTPEIGEDIEKWEMLIQQAVIGGVKIVQIRDKICSAQKMIAMARRIHPFLKNRGVPLLINDRVDSAHAANADGVHLGQSDLKVTEARSILGSRAIIGLSVETLDQALDATHEEISYLAASPIFQTNTKTDCGTPWGLDGLKRLCSMSKHPVVAIGGIDITNVETILECGAIGIAVISALSKALCPKTAAQEILSKMRSYADSRLG